MGAVPLTQRAKAEMSLVGVSTSDLAERILARSIPVPECGCWLWEGTLVNKGYGALSIGDHPHRAHRISYMAFVGSIPDGLFVCHKCDTPACVNPKHLFLGTHSDNMLDSVRKKRHRQSQKDVCPKGHRYDSINAATGCRQCSICRKEYELTHKDELRQKQRQWALEHPERRAELNREWNNTHRERRREINRAFQARNREARAAKCREYYYRKKAERLALAGGS